MLSASMLQLAAVLLPLATATGLVGWRLVARPSPGQRRLWAVVQGTQVATAALVVTAVAAWQLGPGTAVELDLAALVPARWGWRGAVLLLDAPAATFSLLAGGAGAVAAAVARDGWQHERRALAFAVALLVASHALQLIFAAGSVALLVGGWTLAGLAAAAMVGWAWWQPAVVRRATRVATVWIASGAALVAVGCLVVAHAGPQGGRFACRGQAEALAGGHAWVPAGLLVAAAVARAGLLPLGGWLPPALAGPTPANALMGSTILAPAAIFALLRTTFVWREVPGFALLLGAVGGINWVVATARSWSAADLQRRLGHRTQAQVGLMAAELAAGLDQVALAHAVVHALVRGDDVLRSGARVVAAMKAQAVGGVRPVPPLWLPARWPPRPWVAACYQIFARRPFPGPLRWWAWQLAGEAHRGWAAAAVAAAAAALVVATGGALGSLQAWLLAGAAGLAACAWGERQHAQWLLALVLGARLLLAAGSLAAGVGWPLVARALLAPLAGSWMMAAAVAGVLARQHGGAGLLPCTLGLAGAAPRGCALLVAALAGLALPPWAAFPGNDGSLAVVVPAGAAGSVAEALVAAAVLAACALAALRLAVTTAWGPSPQVVAGYDADLGRAAAAWAAMAWAGLQAWAWT